jgi:hypothetical protein
MRELRLIVSLLIIILLCSMPVSASCLTYEGVQEAVGKQALNKEFAELTETDLASIEPLVFSAYETAIRQRYEQVDDATLDAFIERFDNAYDLALSFYQLRGLEYDTDGAVHPENAFIDDIDQFMKNTIAASPAVEQPASQLPQQQAEQEPTMAEDALRARMGHLSNYQGPVLRTSTTAMVTATLLTGVIATALATDIAVPWGSLVGAAATIYGAYKGLQLIRHPIKRSIGLLKTIYNAATFIPNSVAKLSSWFSKDAQTFRSEYNRFIKAKDIATKHQHFTALVSLISQSKQSLTGTDQEVNTKTLKKLGLPEALRPFIASIDKEGNVLDAPVQQESSGRIAATASSLKKWGNRAAVAALVVLPWTTAAYTAFLGLIHRGIPALTMIPVAALTSAGYFGGKYALTKMLSKRSSPSTATPATTSQATDVQPVTADQAIINSLMETLPDDKDAFMDTYVIPFMQGRLPQATEAAGEAAGKITAETIVETTAGTTAETTTQTTAEEQEASLWQRYVERGLITESDAQEVEQSDRPLHMLTERIAARLYAERISDGETFRSSYEERFRHVFNAHYPDSPANEEVLATFDYILAEHILATQMIEDSMLPDEEKEKLLIMLRNGQIIAPEGQNIPERVQDLIDESIAALIRLGVYRAPTPDEDTNRARRGLWRYGLALIIGSLLICELVGLPHCKDHQQVVIAAQAIADEGGENNEVASAIAEGRLNPYAIINDDEIRQMTEMGAPPEEIVGAVRQRQRELGLGEGTLEDYRKAGYAIAYCEDYGGMCMKNCTDTAEEYKTFDCFSKKCCIETGKNLSAS